MRYILSILTIVVGGIITIADNHNCNVYLGIAVMILGIITVLWQRGEDKLKELLNKYEQFKKENNFTIGTIWDYFDPNYKDGTANVFPIWSYLYNLEKEFSNKEVNQLIKHKKIDKSEEKAIALYKNSKDLRFSDNYKI